MRSWSGLCTRPPNSRWYSGAGIYRSVWLKLRDADFLVTDGIYVSSRRLKGTDTWAAAVDCEVEAGSGAAAGGGPHPFPGLKRPRPAPGSCCPQVWAGC